MFEFGDDFMDAEGDLFPVNQACCSGDPDCMNLGDGVWVIASTAVRVVEVSFFASTPALIGVGHRFDATRRANDR